MSKFRFKGMAQIAHLNTRKEGPDDEKELAVDVKLQLRADHGICQFFDEQLVEFLWFSDAAGAVRNPLMSPIGYDTELRDYRVDCAGTSHHGAKVKKFVITPRDGRLVQLSLQVSFKPTSNEVGVLAEYLQDEFEIVIEPETEELDFGDAGTGTTHAAPEAPWEDASDGPDPLYDQAVQIVLDTRKASISMVQRHLRIGYNRAARLLEHMERAGLVTCMDAKGNSELTDLLTEQVQP